MARGAWRPSALLIAGATSLALALASLALPSGPTYDPYAWLIWGRDLAHLKLITTGGGASWKPLPSLVDALLTPLGGAAADGWLVLARAGGLFAVFMAARLAWRLAPPRQRWVAFITAAATLALTHRWVRENGFGAAEGLMTALGLLAVDRHLDGERRQAFALIVAAALIRVEAWPFVALYGAWLWWTTPRTRVRAGIALGWLAIPLLWFGGDWLGSGRFTTAADRALLKKPGTPGASPHPVRSVLIEAHQMLPLPAWIGVAVALAVAAVAVTTRWMTARRADPQPRPARTPRERVALAPTARGEHGVREPAARGESTILVLAAAAALWTAVVAAMAARGYAGLPRFLFMANGLEAVIAGIGLAQIAAGVAWLLTRPVATRRRAFAGAAAAAGALLVTAVSALGSVPDAKLVPADLAAVDKVADMDRALANAVKSAGGATAVLRCGRPTTSWFSVTALAYDLHVATVRVRVHSFGRRHVLFKPVHGTSWDVRARCPAKA